MLALVSITTYSSTGKTLKLYKWQHFGLTIEFKTSAFFYWHLSDQSCKILTLTATVIHVHLNSLVSYINWSAWGHELTSSATQNLPSCFKTQGRGPSASPPPAKAGSVQSDYPKNFSMSAPGLSHFISLRMSAAISYITGCWTLRQGWKHTGKRLGETA